MIRLELVVIGASAGGLEALLQLLEVLPRDLAAAIVIVIHTRSDSNSYLAEILRRRTALPVAVAEEGAVIQPSHLYVAPPDFHVMVHGNRLHLSRGPKENGFRPAIDPLFRSASRAKGAAVMGVVLSGGLDDGSYGLLVIKKGGGITVVQNPDEATVAGMPLNAIRHVGPHYVLGAVEIGKLIAELSERGIAEGAGDAAAGDIATARRRTPDPQNPQEVIDVGGMERAIGPPSGLTCPDCGGALWELKDGALVSYRCHVGHQYTPDSLELEQHDAVEGALWSAVRVLEEHAELRRRMASRARHAGLDTVARGFEERGRDAAAQSEAIRTLIFSRRVPERGAAHATAEGRRRGTREAQPRTERPRAGRKARRRI